MGCRIQRYGPEVTSCWDSVILGWSLQFLPSARCDHSRRMKPARATATPVHRSQTGKRAEAQARSPGKKTKARVENKAATKRVEAAVAIGFLCSLSTVSLSAEGSLRV